jgi:hypothetical protein
MKDFTHPVIADPSGRVTGPQAREFARALYQHYQGTAEPIILAGDDYAERFSNLCDLVVVQLPMARNTAPARATLTTTPASPPARSPSSSSPPQSCRAPPRPNVGTACHAEDEIGHERTRRRFAMSMGLTAELAEGVIEPTAMPAGYGPVPEGTTASRCRACGEIRLHYPGDLRDPWKKHLDHCPGAQAPGHNDPHAGNR